MKSQVLALNRKLACMQVSAACATPIPAAAPVDADDVIRRAIFKRLESAPWWDTGTSNVFVDHGKVVYQGLINHVASRRAAREIAFQHPGVRDVWDARVLRRDW